MPLPMWIALLAVFAGYTASFACVVLERRLEGRKPDGRSRCVCGTPIPMHRNIPIVSWVLQRGRAACCGERIPKWYVVAETATVVVAVASALTAGRVWAGLGGVAVSMAGLWIWHFVKFGDARRRPMH